MEKTELEKLQDAAKKARDESNAAAEKASAGNASKASKETAAELAQKANDAEEAVKTEETRLKQDEAQQKKIDEAAALATAQTGEAPTPPKKINEDDDSQYVPVFLDEDGERIPRNTIMRICTTGKNNLKSLDGLHITDEPIAELHGPNVKKGDWYTTQYQAGLIKVDSTKKLRS